MSKNMPANALRIMGDRIRTGMPAWSRDRSHLWKTVENNRYVDRDREPASRKISPSSEFDSASYFC